MPRSSLVPWAIAAMLCFGVASPADDPAAANARRGPAFLDKATIYQIWLRSFAPEGTIQAAARRLPHIAGLGVSIVYLSPVNVQSHAGGFSNPYRINDYYRIDAEYGTEADLKEFLESAHKLGLKVLMDIVFYHTGPDSVMMQTPSFYMHQDGQIVLGQWHLPRPDFENPRLRDYLIGALLHWARDVGVDGFRCDVSSGVPLDFWEQARAQLDHVNPDLIMLAESENPLEMLHAFDVSYAFSYQTALRQIFAGGEPATRLRTQWEHNRDRFPQGTRMLRASDNHDQKRAIVEFGERGARAASVVNFTMDGIPFLYNGQEIGDTVATDHQSHYPLRWELDRPSGQTGSGLAGGQKQWVAFYKRLFDLRGRETALTSGTVVWITNSLPESVISFERNSAGESMLIIVNASNRKCAGAVQAPPGYRTLFAGQGDKLESGRFQLGAFGYVVSKRSN
jgi:glycosidase